MKNIRHTILESLLSKDDYERRQRNIDRRNIDNKEKGSDKGLTEEQADIIEDIAKLRHEIHTDDSLFNTESQASSQIYYDMEDIFNRIFEYKGTENELPLINLPIQIEDLTTNYDANAWGMTEDDEDWDEDLLSYEEAEEIYKEQVEKINTYLEGWLADIDKKYGTNYAPTGAWRY